MRIKIEFNTDSAAFEDFYAELTYTLQQANSKVLQQLARQPATQCRAPESADKLLDSNGNTVGSVEVCDE